MTRTRGRCSAVDAHTAMQGIQWRAVMLSDNKISNPAIAMGGVTKAMCICPENGDR